MAREFYLVQRIHRGWRADNPDKAKGNKLAKVANVFGNGTLGDYDLDYMGAAEFEWGAIPDAFKRLQDAGKKLSLVEWEYGGHTFDFLYRDKDGEPFEAWMRWAEGRPVDDYGKEWDERTFYGKEIPYELQQRLAGEPPPKYNDGQWRTHIWWALNENVMWAFHEDGHLPRMLESLGVSDGPPRDHAQGVARREPPPVEGRGDGVPERMYREDLKAGRTDFDA